MTKLNVGRVLVPAGLVLSALSGSSLAAQGASAWLPVDLGSNAKADVRGLILPASGGYQVFFKNFGTTTVHFGFYVEGLQTLDAVSGNGRIHLKPGNVAGPLNIQPQPGARGAIRVLAVEAASGESEVPASPSSAS